MPDWDMNGDTTRTGYEAQIARLRDALTKERQIALEAAASVVRNWSLPTIQTPSMWLIDKAGIEAEILALSVKE